MPRPLRLVTTTCLFLTGCTLSLAQSSQRSDVPTIRVTSGLVFLDVTVLDKKGRPVVKGLTKDDFLITENKKPQRIFSFEAPETHVVDVSAADDNLSGKAPVTIFVLDLLNSSFEDFAYIRYEVRKYLETQPARLSSPAELMVLGNQSLEMVQGYTRDKEDLLYTLDHVRPALPYKEMNASFSMERLGQSFEALDQIALQNTGIPGRKNIVWVGHGGPNLYLTNFFAGQFEDELMQDVHSTTNMLVDARISLFVIYPGLPVNGGIPISAREANVELGDDDPFAGDVNFGVFVNETGGKLFYNRNDIDKEIKRSLEMGAEYYTLTYQPHDLDRNGKFRRIRVSLRDPHLRAITKAGYFAPDENPLTNPQQEKMSRLAEAVQSTIPLTALRVSFSHLVRHPDSRTAEFTVELKSANVTFLPTDDGKGAASFTVAAASLKKDRSILAWKTENITLVSTAPEPNRLPEVVSRFPLTIRVPRKTQSLRVALENQDGGRIGAAELDRKSIDAAPATPTPIPQLVPR